MSRLRIALACSALSASILASCDEPTCPLGTTEVRGRCYPDDSLYVFDGGTPMLCSAPCGGGTPFCDYRRGVCVACRDDRACSGATPHCATEVGTCGACANDTHCASTPAMPACDPGTHTCVPCTSDAHCQDPAKPACDLESHACVACTENADCTSPAAPACAPGTHTCAPCTVDLECAHVAGLPRCDATTGRCVACTPASEVADCGAYVCDPLSNVCTTHLRHSVEICGACLSDSECAEKQSCVRRTFLSGTEQVCMWNANETPCSPQGDTRPFGSAQSGNGYIAHETLPDVDHTPREVCTSSFSCAALLDYRSRAACTGIGAHCGLNALGDGWACTSQDETLGFCTLNCNPNDPGACDGVPSRCPGFGSICDVPPL